MLLIRPWSRPLAFSLCFTFSVSAAAEMQLRFSAIAEAVAADESATAPAPTPPVMRVTIDPGHGGSDAGTINAGLREADLVLSVGRKLKDLLAQDQRFEPSLTRNEDVKVSLRERVRRSEMQKADLFVSLHANSSADPRARGMEIYLQNNLPADDDTLLLAAIENQKEILRENEQQAAATLSKKNDLAMILEDLHRGSKARSSLRLSRILSRNWPLEDHRSSRPVRQAPFYVISRSQAPSVLVELGFLTHEHDRTLLLRPEIQDKVADSIYHSILEFRRQSLVTR